MKMTYNEAIKIQRAQIEWYRPWIGRAGIKAIRRETKPCPFNPDAPIFVGDINSLVPRGGSFERYVKIPRRNCGDKWEIRAAVHNAIKRGLI